MPFRNMNLGGLEWRTKVASARDTSVLVHLAGAGEMEVLYVTFSNRKPEASTGLTETARSRELNKYPGTSWSTGG